jgi:signal transduction histidine kinase
MKNVLHPPKLLVIDDELGFRELMLHELEKRGYDVAVAADGEEAVSKARAAGNFDVVVSDLTMPHRNGLETLKEFKAIDPKVEVIMVTGYGTIENAVESIKQGAYDFIAKPFNIDDMLRLIERAIEKRRLCLRVNELQEINRFKSEFMANMSHELRTPMSAILGYTALFLDKVYGGISPRQEEALKRVEAAGQNLLQLMNSILDLSKIAAGRMSVYPEDFDLGDLVKEVAGMLEALAKKKDLRLEWSAPKSLRIRTDRTKLKQILINLVGNGIKFTKTGKVAISAEMAEDRPLLRIRVRDRGIGIRAEDMPLLFEEFRQLDPSATREQGGTGLGLALSKKFVELLGGTIDVESTVGVGSVFTVTVPILGRPPKEPSPVFLASDKSRRKKMLLAIDDDPEVLTLLRDSLEGTSYGFAGALTGEEGLLLAKKLKPLAITLDIMMPHRDGWSVLQVLKNDFDMRSIPVIMLSILDDRNLGYAMGVADYIVKPFARKELLEKLKMLDVQSRPRRYKKPLSPQSVLVADNEESVVDFLVETLRNEGYHVEAVTSGKRALEKLAEQAPDILFVGLMLPEVSGLDVIAYLQNSPELKNVCVIVLTSKHLSPQETDYLQSRVELIVQKDSKNLAEILATVKERLKMLGKSR